VHDARVFINSDLSERLLLPETLPGGSYLIGDSAYALTESLITPFKKRGGALSREEEKFNFIHSSTRMAIEKAFGVLKGRFRRLKLLDVWELDFMLLVIMVACVLHNLRLFDGNVEDFLEERLSDDKEEEVESLFPSETSGARKRQQLMQELCL
jgi:hypothetical protein